MMMREHERQPVSDWPGIDELLRRREEGWSLVGLEWERETVSAVPPSGSAKALEIPYGLRATADGFHLEDQPAERRVLMVILNSIVDDRPLSQAAADLNQAGHTTRDGQPWTPAEVFELLPRLIDAGPAILASPDWVIQRERASKIA